MRPSIILLLAGFAAFGASAQTPPPSPPAPPPPRGVVGESVEYQRCLERARDTPLQGYLDAVQWAQRGGGDAALHCQGMALLTLDRPREAAEAFEQAAARATARPPGLRADLLAQSARAWRAAGDETRALAVIGRAIAVAPRAPAAYIDRAEIHVAARRFFEAIDDLNRALDVGGPRTEALVLRASAWRNLQTLDLASEDVDRALALNDQLPEAYLERGLIRRARANLAGAREDFLRVLQLDPDGPAGETVREIIQQMEIGEDPPAPR